MRRSFIFSLVLPPRLWERALKRGPGPPGGEARGPGNWLVGTAMASARVLLRLFSFLGTLLFVRPGTSEIILLFPLVVVGGAAFSFVTAGAA